MSCHVEVPVWLRAKSGESIDHKFLKWVQDTQRKLRRARPPAENAFLRIVDKMKSRMSVRWQRALHYTTQKYFIVAPGIVFFGDLYFRSVRLLVEIDGTSHQGPAAVEKDEWRSSLISAWGNSRTVRFRNSEVLDGDFRSVEWKLIKAMAEPRNATSRKLVEAYRKSQAKHPHIYQLSQVLPTRKKLRPLQPPLPHDLQMAEAHLDSISRQV